MPKGEPYREPTAEEQERFWVLNAAHAKAKQELDTFLESFPENTAFRFFPPDDIHIAFESEKAR